MSRYFSRYCVVNLLCWRSSVECLMRLMKNIVVNEQYKSLADAQPAAHSQCMETVDPHLQCVNPFFDMVSDREIDPAAQS